MSTCIYLAAPSCSRPVASVWGLPAGASQVAAGRAYGCRISALRRALQDRVTAPAPSALVDVAATLEGTSVLVPVAADLGGAFPRFFCGRGAGEGHDCRFDGFQPFRHVWVILGRETAVLSLVCGTEAAVTPVHLLCLAGEADGIEGRIDL